MLNKDDFFLLLNQAAVLGIVDFVQAVHPSCNALLVVEAPRASTEYCAVGARFEMGAGGGWAICGVGDMVRTAVDSRLAQFGIKTPSAARCHGAFVAGIHLFTSRRTGMSRVPFEIVMKCW